MSAGRTDLAWREAYRQTAVAALAATAALGGPADASGQDAEPWTIKEFEVVAVEPAGEVDDLGDLGLFVEEMAREIRTNTDYDPDFPPIWDEPTVSGPEIERAKTAIEETLEQAAAKLEAWGFPPPALEPIVETQAGADAYRVYLVTGRDFSGAYHPEPCAHGLREAVLVFNADVVLNGAALTDFGVQTVVHELVHAIQGSLPAYSCGDAYPGQWIHEGTARAIGSDVLRQLRGEDSFGGWWREAWGVRMYSEPLPVPGVTGTSRAYGTSSFWRFLAEYSASYPTWPGPEESQPVDYGYLPPLLERDLSPRDCGAEGGPCDSELRWIDEGLTGEFLAPLREIYARFMQAYARYGEERVHATEKKTQKNTPETWRKNWLGSSFAHEEGMGCAEVVLGPDPDGRQKKFVVPRFPDVAAMCWEVDLEGFEDAVTLAVTASYRPGTEPLLEQLTAVMADTSGRVDRAEVRTVADVPEASWYYSHLSPGDPTLFLLTNVAESPDATRGLANLSVIFTALKSNAVVGVSGPGVSGGSGASEGPAVSGAAGPDFTVTDWWYGVEGSDQVAKIADAYGEAPPPGNACKVSLTLTSQDANGERLIQVPLHGWVPAPLAPGVWPLVPGHVATENPFGVFQTNVGLSCEYGGCYEYDLDETDGIVDTLPHLRMQNFHGEVEIADVSRSHVAGHFDITASADAKYVGLTLNGVFNVTYQGPNSWISDGGRLRPPELPEDHMCAPLDPSSTSGEGGGGGGGEDDGVDDGGGGADEGEEDNGGEPSPERREEPSAEEDEELPAEAARNHPAEAGEEAPDQAGEDPPARPEREAEPEARKGELRGPKLILDFVESRESVLRSEPQAVRGTGSVGRVSLSSTSYDLTVALPVFGCSVKPPEGLSGLDMVEYQRAYNRWRQSGQNTGNEILFDFTAVDVRLDAATGEVVLELEGADGGVTLRGSTENALNLRGGGPGTVIAEGSDLTLEMTRGEDTFSCVEPMGLSFTVSEAP